MEFVGGQTRVRLYAGVRRIDIRTRLCNQEKFVRYRVVFPTSIRDGANVQEIPFGAIQRPDGIEFPAQNWMDWSDGQRGVTLFNRGLPGNNCADGMLMLSLLRSTCIVAYGFFGGYEPGMSSDTGFELGKEMVFDYALSPHAGDWRQAPRAGLEYNHPLLVQKTTCHAGDLPRRGGWLEVKHPQIVLSALKPGEAGGAILRLYEAAGRPAQGVEISLPENLAAAEEVNLMEDAGPALALDGRTLRLDFRPFEIKTIKLTGKGA